MDMTPEGMRRDWCRRHVPGVISTSQPCSNDKAISGPLALLEHWGLYMLLSAHGNAYCV